MIKRIIALERKYKEAMERIEVLEARLDLLQGKPRGPITMMEARLANERGDKATVQRYLVDLVAGVYSKPNSLGDGSPFLALLIGLIPNCQ